MSKSIKAFAVFAAASLALGACSAGSDSATSGDGKAAADPGEAGFDVSGINPDPAVVKLVPTDITASGVLSNGASTDYAPAEYRKQDGQTATGYDVDIVKALAKVMGLKEGTTTHAEFDSLLPQIGSKFNIGVSSFTITPERLQQVNMISYAKVGFSYGVPAGNPGKFDANDVCGKVIGVQTGTAQFDAVEEMSKKCVADGKPAIDIKPHKTQSEVTQKVVGGQYDATLADSPVIGYASALTNGKLEKLGEPFDTAEHGIVVAKDNEQLAKAVEAGLNKLMADGTLKKIMDHYGSGDAALDKAVLNPQTK